MIEKIIETLGSIALGVAGGHQDPKKKKRDLIALCVFGVVIITVFAIVFYRLDS